MISDIIGCTIASPGYFDLAQKAAARFRKFTGCDCLILTSERRESYDNKLALPHLGNRTVCFFDADLWFIRQVNLEPFRQMAGVSAVIDAGRKLEKSFCLPDCATFNLDVERYVNTGLLILNPRDPLVLEAFRIAENVLAQAKAGAVELADYGEQSALNVGFQQAGVQVNFLPDEWNFWPKAWQWGCYERLPLAPKALHAAGVQAGKMEFLEAQCRVWEF